jgi:hypothetical protein
MDLKENFVKLQLIHVRLVRAATVVIVSFQKVPRTMYADVIHLLLEKIVKHTTTHAWKHLVYVKMVVVAWLRQKAINASARLLMAEKSKKR